MNARIRRRPVEPDGERRRQSPSGAIFACILAAATMTSGCAGVGDRNGTGPDSGGASAKGPAATEPGRAAEVNAEVPAETTARMTVEVTVEGVEDPLARNVRAHLSLAKEACDAPRWRMERLLERAAD
ncbi:MAG: hypothetical protein OXC25_12380, partial [Thiotrichales bacterium]|nr:hypothetical protein [Thiotrichales bacterium]